MQNKQKTSASQKKSILIAVGLVLLITAVITVYALTRSGSAGRTKTGTGSGATAAPAADATLESGAAAAPAVDATLLWGEWRQTGEHPTGLITLGLHGDNTAAISRLDVFDGQLTPVSARWAVEGNQLWITDGNGGADQYTVTLDGDTMTLSGSMGKPLVYERVKEDGNP